MASAPPPYDVTMTDRAHAMAAGQSRRDRIEELRAAVEDYQPGQTIRIRRNRPKNPPEIARIGLFGAPGVGKSAHINSLLYVTGRGWHHEAPEAYRGLSGGEQMTRTKRVYHLTNWLCVCDNRGMLDFSGKHMTEVCQQLAGVRSDGSDVVWDRGFLRRMVASLERAWNAKEEFKLHCAIIVLSAAGLPMLRASDMGELFQTIVRMIGEPPIIVITHKNSTPKQEYVREFKAGLLEQRIDYVFEIENYTEEDHGYSEEKHVELLEILDVSLGVADKVMIHAEETASGCTIL